jgi:hypothetical protein
MENFFFSMPIEGVRMCGRANWNSEYSLPKPEIHMNEKEQSKEEITLVAPNGATLQDKYRPHDTVQKSLDHAVKEFAKNGQLDPSVGYILVLGDTPLDNVLTLEKAGVQAGAKLKIRSKKVPGDGDAS